MTSEAWVQVIHVVDDGLWVQNSEAFGLTGCGQCSVKSGCTSQWLGSMCSVKASRSQQLFLDRRQIGQNACEDRKQPGQRLKLTYPDKTLLLGACLIFGVPLLGILIGLSLGTLIGYNLGLDSDMPALVGLASGLVLTAYGLKLIKADFLRDKLLPKLSIL